MILKWFSKRISGVFNETSSDPVREYPADIQSEHGVQENTSALILKASQTAKEVSLRSSTMLEETRDMLGEAKIQTKAAERSAVSIEQMNNRIRDVSVRSEGLVATLKESSDVFGHITGTIAELTRKVSLLNRSVEATSSSISAMASSFKNVDENVGTLLKEVEMTSSKMTEMDRTLGEMCQNITDSSTLSQELCDNVETGRETVAQSASEMDRIKAYADDVTLVIRNLQKKTETIGNFLKVIEDVSEQTNLLALNAAIIASKAGRHGKGFGIVSNEIKELSDRTASSTQEVHAIINDLQAESKMAEKTIEMGNKRIEAGVEFSKAAHEALNRMMGSFERSSERVKGVVKIVREQESGVKRVIDSMARVNGMVYEIASATNTHNKESYRISEATGRIRVMTGELDTVMGSQSKCMEEVNEMIRDVSSRAKKIADTTSNQQRRSEDVFHAIDQIKKVTLATEDAIKDVSFTVKELTIQTKALERNISRLQ